MAVLLQDDFNRANSTTSIGSPVVGGPYSFAGTGVWGINNNEAYMSTAATGGQVLFPAAVNVTISARMPVNPSSSVQSGLIIRWVDANNFWLLQAMNPQIVRLYRCAVGTFYQMSTDAPYATNETFSLRAYGDQIAWYVGSKQYGVITDQWFATAGTVAGIRNGGSNTARWDDLLAQDQLDPINSWGSSAEITDVDPVPVASDYLIVPSLYKGRDTALADESEIP